MKIKNNFNKWRERLGIEPSSANKLQTTALKAAESTSNSIIPKILALNWTVQYSKIYT